MSFGADITRYFLDITSYLSIPKIIIALLVLPILFWGVYELLKKDKRIVALEAKIKNIGEDLMENLLFCRKEEEKLTTSIKLKNEKLQTLKGEIEKEETDLIEFKTKIYSEKESAEEDLKKTLEALKEEKKIAKDTTTYFLKKLHTLAQMHDDSLISSSQFTHVFFEHIKFINQPFEIENVLSRLKQLHSEGYVTEAGYQEISDYFLKTWSEKDFSVLKKLKHKFL